jgi:hypothetical protein
MGIIKPVNLMENYQDVFMRTWSNPSWMARKVPWDHFAHAWLAPAATGT